MASISIMAYNNVCNVNDPNNNNKCNENVADIINILWLCMYVCVLCINVCVMYQ